MGRGRRAKQSDAQGMTRKTEDPSHQEGGWGSPYLGFTLLHCILPCWAERPEGLRGRVVHMEGPSMQEASRGHPSRLHPAVVVSGVVPGV